MLCSPLDGDGDHHVAVTNAVRAEHGIRLDRADRRPGDVVIVRSEESPGCSAVSPPTRAVPVAAQAFAIPATMVCDPLPARPARRRCNPS